MDIMMQRLIVLAISCGTRGENQSTHLLIYKTNSYQCHKIIQVKLSRRPTTSHPTPPAQTPTQILQLYSQPENFKGPTVTPTSTEQPAHPPLHPFLGHHLAAVPTISSLQATAVDTYASRAFAPRPMVTQRCIMNMGLDGRRLFADFDHHRSVACLLWPLISPDDRMIQIGSWMGRVKHYWVCSWSRFWLYPSPWFTTGLSSRPLGMMTE